MSATLLWFRHHDLRLDDNPALNAACARATPLLPIYIDESPMAWQPGAAARSWRHRSLAALNTALNALGSTLLLCRGDAAVILPRLCTLTGADAIHWNRRYEPAQRQHDMAIKQQLQALGIAVESHNGALLVEPWQLCKADATPYRVFTPFWKRLAAQPLTPPLNRPTQLPPPPPCPSTATDSEGNAIALTLEALALRPRSDWDRGFDECWQAGESAAQQQLQRFIDQGLMRYRQQRDLPAAAATSHLSIHLAHGEIGVRRIAATIRAQQQAFVAESGRADGSQRFSANAGESYLRQLAWREFGYHLLYHFPDTPDHPLDQRFCHYPWAQQYAATLRAWQRGESGIPIVDAAMRALWQSGWMHNRLRMVVASLLTKQLQIPWQQGAAWFWQTLIDADLANNTLGWQWVAGCGADAAPYFRIFNPLLQSAKFDPEGVFLRRWLPELRALPLPHLHQPWQAPATLLRQAGVVLDRDYPRPIVDLAAGRAAALAGYQQITAANR